ncbi:hypothetical protein DFH11DRAFT_1735044 [Phellopilus nigrolimitatus]|nr:hypothetical protein DFH11DRAFT_1735044 [Phellopilus nigrolimitatus]
MSTSAGRALSFLATRWSTAALAFITCRPASDLRAADAVHIVPAEHRGKGEIVHLRKKDPVDPLTYIFSYTYVLLSENPPVSAPLPYLSSARPPLAELQLTSGRAALGSTTSDIRSHLTEPPPTVRLELLCVSARSRGWAPPPPRGGPRKFAPRKRPRRPRPRRSFAPWSGSLRVRGEQAGWRRRLCGSCVAFASMICCFWCAAAGAARFRSDGTSDIGALKHAHVGVPLLDGTQDDLKKIAEYQRLKVYETQLKLSARYGKGM